MGALRQGSRCEGWTRFSTQTERRFATCLDAAFHFGRRFVRRLGVEGPFVVQEEVELAEDASVGVPARGLHYHIYNIPDIIAFAGLHHHITIFLT